MRRGFLASFLVLLLGCRKPASDWDQTKSWIRSEFPGVEHISPEELRRRLDAGPKAPILLDARTRDEFEVSHLKGALRVDPDEGLPDFLRALDRKTTVVAYCSVGYRSSRLVDRLQKEGFTDAKNLEGSIFEWANKGYPVERDGDPVKEVHPFDEKWGRLLDPPLHSYRPRFRSP
jgi:rhodanese-related sulfurtransferase